MARLAADSKMGYYPTPERSLDHIVRWVGREHARRGQDKIVHVMDPCCGEGATLNAVCQGANLYPFRSWGIELDIDLGNDHAELEPLPRAPRVDSRS